MNLAFIFCAKLTEVIFGRIVVPEDGYLAEVHALCKDHNVLLICDEIQTVCFFPLVNCYLRELNALIGPVPNWQDAGFRIRWHQTGYSPPWQGLVWWR
jgi:hypothetical protein